MPETQVSEAQDPAFPHRWPPLSILWCALAITLSGPITASSPDSSSVGVPLGPDLVVAEIASVAHFGAHDSTHAYAIGTTSCNVGDEPIWWCAGPQAYCNAEQHPVAGQNMYRLKDGRFEQIGMSWLRHLTVALGSIHPRCGSCQTPTHPGDQLGIGCADSTSAGVNGNRPLGPRSELQAAAGTFPFPFSEIGFSTTTDQRLQIAASDLEPAQNLDARYWLEAHYVAADDAAAGHGLNNASYREATVTPATLSLALIGDTVFQQPALFAWQAADPEVEIVAADIPSSAPIERFHVARRITSTDNGYHYEYAVHNMNADRSARGFTVRFPSSASITDAGMHQVPHHSGEPYSTASWDAQVSDDRVTWQTDDEATDVNANALRWGTTFSFWFDSTLPPDQSSHSLQLFRAGTPSSIEIVFPGGQIFQDGFESGDAGAWSATP